MELKLKKPELYEYSVANHLEFNKTAIIIFDKNGAVINAPDLLADYRLKVIQEDKVFKWVHVSDFTEKKAEADLSRDKTLTGILFKLRADVRHFDPSIRDSAKHVLNLIENYGDLVNADYNAETAGIDSVIEKLGSDKYVLAVQALGLSPWLTELARYNNIFKGYAADTEQERVEKTNISSRAARRQTDEALRKITSRVTALIELNGPDAYEILVTEFNVHVSVYNTVANEHYGRLHAKTDISSGEVDPIAVQPYTGNPAYVIPTVRIRKTEKDGTETVVELRFTEDFTISYKNNVAPGTATLTISGIGKYTGEIITTFNIAAQV
jgi:hypothetical protein